MNRLQRWLALTIGFGAWSSGCSHADCQSDSDCGSDQRCVYPVADGCAAKGVCQSPPSGTNCDALAEYCGCDGSHVSVGCGWSGGSVPVEGSNTGACGHGNQEAGAACMSSADCGRSQNCYYPIADGCSATGVCLEDDGGPLAYGCENTPVYCDCDGGRTETVCGGHDGYVAAPVSRAVDQQSECSMPSTSILVPTGDAGPQP
ncbi:MAG TPA: hypothetical protein VK745_11850 [Polyangiaceae bacterium]|nr:hypothetical protein [Polyangiaceae bacterium]